MQGKTEQEEHPYIDPVRFGKKLREVCESKNVTAADLKEQLNLNSVQAVYYWFSGRRLPNAENLYALSRYLGVRMDDLINGDRRREAEAIIGEDCLPEHGKRIMMYWTRLSKLSKRN